MPAVPTQPWSLLPSLAGRVVEEDDTSYRLGDATCQPQQRPSNPPPTYERCHAASL